MKENMKRLIEPRGV